MKKLIFGSKIESVVEQLLCRVVLDSVDGEIELLGRKFLTNPSWGIVADGWSISGYYRFNLADDEVVSFDGALEFSFDGDWDIYLSDLLIFKMVYGDSYIESNRRSGTYPFVQFKNGCAL